MAGNWAEAAIRSFETVSNILDKREIMAREEADRKIREEERLANKPILEARRKYDMELLTQQRNLMFDSGLTGKIASAIDKVSKGEPLNEDETGAVLMGKTKAYNWKDDTPEQANEHTRALRIVGERVKTMEPMLLSAIQGKQAVTISREEDPDFFNALDKLPAYGGSANKGLADDGLPAKSKTLSQAIVTPDGNMVLKLRVERQNGEVYYAPVTVGRDANPNAPVLQIPVALFGQKLQQELKFADALDSVMKTLGGQKTAEALVQAREDAKKSEAHLAGEIAVSEFLVANPENEANVNAVRALYLQAARGKAKELGVSLSEESLKSGAGIYLQGRGRRGEILYDTDGNAVSVSTQEEKDRAVTAGYKLTRPPADKKAPADTPEVATFKQLYPDVPLNSSRGRELFRSFRQDSASDKRKPEGAEKPISDQALTAKEKELKTRVDDWVLKSGYDEEGTDAGIVRDAREAAAESLKQKGTTIEKALGVAVKALPKKESNEQGLWDKIKKVASPSGRNITRPASPPSPVVSSINPGDKTTSPNGTIARGTGQDAGKVFIVVNGVWIDAKRKR